MALKNIIGDLKTIGFDVAIATPNVKREFSLTIKVEDDIIVYKSDEIQFVLKILRILLEKSKSSNETLFYKIFSEIRNFEMILTKNNIKDIKNLISLCKETDKIYVAQSDVEIKNIMKQIDNKWRLIIPLDAVNTVTEAIERILLFTKTNNIECVIGNLKIDLSKTAPLFFLVKNSFIYAAITDYLDVLILSHHLNNNSEILDGVFLSSSEYIWLLSFDSLESKFSQEKVDYSLRLYNELNGQEYKKQIKIYLDSKELNQNKKLNEAVEVIQCIVSCPGDVNELIRCIYKIYLSQKSSNKIKELELSSFENLDWKILDKTLRSLQNDKYPLYACVKLTYDLINDAIDNNFHKDQVEKADGAISSILNQSGYQQYLLDKIEQYMKEEIAENRLRSILKCLKEYIPNYLIESYDFNLKSLIELCRIQVKNSNHDEISNTFHSIANGFIERISFDKFYTITIKDDIKSKLKKNYFFLILKKLNNCLNFSIDNLFKGFAFIVEKKKNPQVPLDLLNKLFDLSEEQIKSLWKNKRFLYLVNANLNESFLNKLVNFSLKFNYLKEILPNNIKEKLDDNNNVNIISKPFNNVEELIKHMTSYEKQRLRNLPEDFLKYFPESILKNSEIHNFLTDANVLDSWNGKYFKKTWNLEHVIKTLKYYDEVKSLDQTDLSKININLNSQNHIQEEFSSTILIHKKYHNIMGENVKMMIPKDFIKVTSILKREKMEINHRQQWASLLRLYYIQNIKMWGCGVLHPVDIAELINKESNSETNNSNYDEEPEFDSEIFNDFEKNTTDIKIPLSRLDLLTCKFFRILN